MRAGTDSEMYDSLVKPLEGELGVWDSPTTDEGKLKLSCNIMKKYNPDLLTIHFGQIDYLRHRYGMFCDKVEEGVRKSERFLARFMQASMDAGTFHDTDFVVLSDHGQLNYSRIMNLNAVFSRESLVKTNPDGSFRDWEIWAESANFSAQIYIKNESLSLRAMERLCSLQIGMSRFSLRRRSLLPDIVAEAMATILLPALSRFSMPSVLISSEKLSSNAGPLLTRRRLSPDS